MKALGILAFFAIVLFLGGSANRTYAVPPAQMIGPQVSIPEAFSPESPIRRPDS